MSQTCKKCGSDDFTTNGMVKGKPRYRCRPCHNARSRMYDSIDPSKSKERRAKYAASGKKRIYSVTKLYGITSEEYLELYEKQKNICAICLKQETVTDKRNNMPRNLAVDHCHMTGKIRGLLCARCNKAIGLFKEDLEVIKNSIKYLESF